MGRATKWFRNLLGLKKPDPNPPPSPTSRSASNSDKRRWSFVKSLREKHEIPAAKNNPNSSPYGPRGWDLHREPIDVSDAVADPGKHAIAVAAATAAVAEAAVAAAQAAAAAVRLTSSGRCAREPMASFGARERWAAVKIQSTFRGYLARRALRALRGLVRLQALVRGHIERKRTAHWMRSMQALLRAQARARAGRSQIPESSQSSSKSSHFHHPGPQTPEKLEQPVRSRSAKFDQPCSLKRNGSKSNGRLFADHESLCGGWNWSERVPSTRINAPEHERDDKIVEVDTGKPHFTARRRNLFHSTHLALTPEQFISSFTNSKDSHQTVSSPSSGEVQSLGPLKFAHEIEEPFYTAVNSPRFYTVSSKGDASRRSPFTPTRSDCSRSYLSSFSEYCPSYMSCTESSKAKMRSISAPKQRTQYERSSSTKRSVQKSSLYTSFASKAYPGSGRLDCLGMPVGQGY